MPLRREQSRGRRALAVLRATLQRRLSLRMVLFCVAILALNLVDAFATLHHLEHGAEEVNPLMAAVLRAGPLAFILVKHALAAVGVLGIALYPAQRAAQVAMAILFPLYSLLAVYQLGLFYLT